MFFKWRNDLGIISKFVIVQVEILHSIKCYSQVMHIGYTIRSKIKEEFDAIENFLLIGTLLGAPKIRACQIIDELENNKRGIDLCKCCILI